MNTRRTRWWSPGIGLWSTVLVLVLTAGTATAVAAAGGPATASAAPYCGIRWGSLDKTTPGYPSCLEGGGLLDRGVHFVAGVGAALNVG